jgi:hypothetical protein
MDYFQTHRSNVFLSGFQVDQDVGRVTYLIFRNTLEKLHLTGLINPDFNILPFQK